MTQSLSRRLIGRRREIVALLKKGQYRDWLLDEHKKNQERKLFNQFRERICQRRSQLPMEELCDCQLAEPDISVFFPFDTKGPWGPERRLWGAVLIRAIYDVVNFHLDAGEPSKLHKRMGLEAYKWLENKEQYVGSFPWICSMLSIGPHENLLARILLLKRGDLPRQCASSKTKSNP